ncbi:MAG: hypothetical protein HY897_21075 [Deltaproteobacteria bacterium]|nr:hypothetical protein [Deltaproteobacteria bacterium]
MNSKVLLFAAAAAALAAAGCFVDVAGAPCADDENCPVGQVCGAGGTCEFGGGSGPADTGGAGGKDAGRDATKGDGPADAGITDDGQVRDAGGDGVADSGVDAGGQSDGSDMSDVSDGSLPDAGADAASDAGGDAGIDAGIDTGPDTGGDGGADGGFDGGGCATSQDCGGARCCNGTCAPVERGCCEARDCLGVLAGNLCKDLVCQCATEWDCPGTERICDTSASPPTCVDGCTDQKCGIGKVCCGKDCYTGECCENADCTIPGEPTCKVIVHTCTDNCGVDAPDCGKGYVCCVDKCKRGDCCENADCAVSPNGKYCVANKCSQVCVEDANCPNGRCCTKGPFLGTCYTGNCCDDTQCYAPETCGGGGTSWWCGCTPETKDEFCGRLGKECGTVTGVDNCGNTRSNVLCGVCPECMGCDEGVCRAASHAFASCDAASGDVWWYDSCGNPEEVKDKCSENGWLCVGDACCAPESDPDLCAAWGKNCGEFTADDNCGQQRTVYCGDCAGGWTCGLHEANVCGCDPDATVCDGKDCGQVVDNCGETVVCGTCFLPDCCDFKCYDIQTDRAHCGDCVTMCAWDEVCTAGDCKPLAWETVGDAVNPVNAGLAHALGTDGTDPIVAWVGAAAPLDGGAAINSAYAHEFSGGSWRQLGPTVSGLDFVQSVVDVQVRTGTPHVVYAETMDGGTIHLKLFNGQTGTWTEGGAPGYVPPCSGLMSLALAPQDYSGQPNITLAGAGGCGIGVGYAYWNGNAWWQTPMPPAPLKPGLMTTNGSGNSDVVHDGTTAFVALADAGSIFVRYWKPDPLPGAWVNLGGALNAGPIPVGAGTGAAVLSLALNPGRSPVAAYVEDVNNVKTVFVKGYDPTGWITIGGGSVSGPGAADSPSLAMVDGLPYLAFVQMEGAAGAVQVRRWNGQEWQRVGSPLTMDVFTTPEAPYIVGIGKVPYVAFRQKDGLGIARIYVAKFVAP